MAFVLVEDDVGFEGRSTMGSAGLWKVGHGWRFEGSRTISREGARKGWFGHGAVVVMYCCVASLGERRGEGELG
jgi:hypothetical protein